MCKGVHDIHSTLFNFRIVCLVCSHKKCMVKLGDYCLRAKPPAVPTLALSHLPLNSPRPPLISSARTRQYTTFTTVQLRQEITDLDKEEQKAIDSVNLKFELQMSEILDELASRYLLTHAYRSIFHQIDINWKSMKQRTKQTNKNSNCLQKLNDENQRPNSLSKRNQRTVATKYSNQFLFLVITTVWLECIQVPQMVEPIKRNNFKNTVHNKIV